MRTILSLAAGLILAIGSALAQPMLPIPSGGGTVVAAPTGTCPYSGYLYDYDGCAGADQAARRRACS